MKKNVVIILTTLLINPLFLTSAKADPSPGEELFIFHFGYYLPYFDTKLRVDNETYGKGSEVSAEDDLGLDSQESIFRGDVTWRMSDRNRLQLGFFRFGREGEKEINRDLQIGDEIYPAGVTLNTSLKLTVIPISYFYSFLKTSEWEVAGGAGLQWSSIRFDVDGSASLGGTDSSDEARADADAPLPLLAFDLKYYIFPEWSVGTNLGAFVYKIGASNMTFQGEILSAAINTDYWFSTYVGAGFALNWFSINVDVDSEKWNGSFNYSYWGPQIYLSGRF